MYQQIHREKHICTEMKIHIYIYIYIYIRIQIYISIKHTYIYTHANIHIHKYIHIYAYNIQYMISKEQQIAQEIGVKIKNVKNMGESKWKKQGEGQIGK